MFFMKSLIKLMALNGHFGKHSQPAPRITNIEPWFRQAVEKAYQRIGKDWDKIEATATRAQGRPDFDD
jgi:hypothetical protein